MHEKSVTSSIKSRGRGESEWREVRRVNSDVVKRWRGHKSKRNTWFRKGTQAEQMRCLKGPTWNPIPFRNGFNNNIFPLFLTPHRFSSFCSITCGKCLFMSPFQTWRRLFSHVLSHSWSCKAATLEYDHLKSAVAWYGTFTANVRRICDLVSTPTRHRFAFTFVVGDAVVEALRPVGRGGSVEGLHREGAGWRRLRPVLQRLFWRSKMKNHVVWWSVPSRWLAEFRRRVTKRLTVVVAKILIPSAVSGQRPGLPFVALTELYYTVLIQLYPGPLWVDHLPQKRHSLSTLTHTWQ